jgi:hypothetical protein
LSILLRRRLVGIALMRRRLCLSRELLWGLPVRLSRCLSWELLRGLSIRLSWCLSWELLRGLAMIGRLALGRILPRRGLSIRLLELAGGSLAGRAWRRLIPWIATWRGLAMLLLKRVHFNMYLVWKDGIDR